MKPSPLPTLLATLLLALLLAFCAACDGGGDEGRINYLDEAEQTDNPQKVQGRPTNFGDDEQPGNDACPAPRVVSDCADERPVWVKVGDVPMCCFYEQACQVPNPEWAAFAAEDACEATLDI